MFSKRPKSACHAGHILYSFEGTKYYDRSNRENKSTNFLNSIKKKLKTIQ
jgi:hypothetical protein